MLRIAIPIAGAIVLSGCVAAGHPVPGTAAAPPVPKTLQWLHGSGEAAVLSRASYRAMTGYVIAALAARAQGRTVPTAVLAADGTPEAPRWEACGTKPAAVILDIDETSILNSGANYDGARRGDPAHDPARWADYERTGAAFVEPVPGAVEAIAAFRAAGVTPIFISNRQARYAAQAAEALKGAGLGEAVPGETLFNRPDVPAGAGKDARRAAVAARWCVLAMAGDQLGDFSDFFNASGLTVPARRARAQAAGIADRWGQGWFLLPNPVYGPGVAGGLDDLFPMDKRWPGPVHEEMR